MHHTLHPLSNCSGSQLCSCRVADGERALARMQTSVYTTLELSTADDLVCQICLGTLHQCVALQPCGHNFCATCASQHFGTLLQVRSYTQYPRACTLNPNFEPPHYMVHQRTHTGGSTAAHTIPHRNISCVLRAPCVHLVHALAQAESLACALSSPHGE